MRALLIVLALVLALAGAAGVGALADSAWTPSGYRLAVPPYAYRFPDEHRSHAEFKTEWWYYTGHLEGEGRRFGFELTFFRVGVDPARLGAASAWALHTIYFAHFALTDERGRRFMFFERIARPALGMAGADTTRLNVWIDDWYARLADDGRTHRLHAVDGRAGLQLALRPLKPPVVHGTGGVSQKGQGWGRASHYYSLTRMEARGHVRVDGRRVDVEGLAWMDHEFGSNQLGPDQAGWDWFSMQLDDGSELMLYRMRLADGRDDPHSSGTLVRADGTWRHLPRDAFEIEATGTWTSEVSGGAYPSGWIVRVPSEHLALTISPTLVDQELVTGGRVNITYWEGSVTVTGSAADTRVGGRGYVELTGYAGRVPGF